MTQELRERVEKAIRKLIKPQHPQQVSDIADAAIALVLEEAQTAVRERLLTMSCTRSFAAEEAIRSLKEKK